MKTKQTTSLARKVGIYERPASADRLVAWVPMAIAVAVVIAWGTYVFLAR